MLGGVSISEVLRLLQAHVGLSLAALGLALCVGIPLALLSAGRPRLRGGVLGTAAIFQTVPGLALLALFYPALLLLGQATGLAIPALGFLPALLALTLYAMLPIVRNAVTGIEQVDPVLIDVADGLGMTRAQRLRFVEVPLSAPVMLAGIRTAAVWTFGAATLATKVGQPSLGNLIFSGLQLEDWSRVLVGCFAAAAIALVVDGLLALLSHGVAVRSSGKKLLALVGMAGLAVLALLPLSAKTSEGDDRRPIVIGAKNFSEQYILAELLADRLNEAGYTTEKRVNLGSAIAYRAVASGDIDIYVDYTGTLWSNVLGRDDRPSRDEMLASLRVELQGRDGVTLLAPLGFENAYAFAIPRSLSERQSIRTLNELANAAPDLAFGTDLEFTERPEWQSVQSAYGMRFKAITSFSPTFMYRAIADGSVDAISAFSSDGRIAALDLVTLEDTRSAMPRYDAVILLSERAAADAQLRAALEPLREAISIADMRRANLLVDRDKDKKSASEAARLLESAMAGETPYD